MFMHRCRRNDSLHKWCPNHFFRLLTSFPVFSPRSFKISKDTITVSLESSNRCNSKVLTLSFYIVVCESIWYFIRFLFEIVPQWIFSHVVFGNISFFMICSKPQLPFFHKRSLKNYLLWSPCVSFVNICRKQSPPPQIIWSCILRHLTANITASFLLPTVSWRNPPLFYDFAPRKELL